VTIIGKSRRPFSCDRSGCRLREDCAGQASNHCPYYCAPAAAWDGETAVISVRTLIDLRRMPPERIVANYAGHTRSQFARGGLPVLIAARDEERDLPATLLAMAASRVPLVPFVGANGCTDRTESFARAMGATVRVGGTHKMDAVQRMLAELISRGERTVLFTDADTIVGPEWAHAMSVNMSCSISKVRFGSVLYTHGPARRVDAVRNLLAVGKDFTRRVSRRRPVGRGANMSISLADEADIQRFMSLPSNLFIGEEEAIADLIQLNGGDVGRCLRPSAIAITRGDRYDSLATLMRLRRIEDRVSLSSKAYGDCRPHLVSGSDV
jgi:hypothetical protein